ncbi:hypothetical protein ACIQFU_37115 [Streptomyces sp. NPDC093065]|uniref:hypothetical protein n=1 Tax=Streptomyces sp. NPDC093065 TaxID=3366021 RepID=UPI0038198F7E
MSKNTGAPVRNRMVEAAKAQNDNQQATVPQHSRLTMAHALLIITFPALGCVLHLVGRMETDQILQLLGGCGGIGASIMLLVTSGRRMASAAGGALGRAIRAVLSNGQ